jgi:hypothetical protein
MNTLGNPSQPVLAGFGMRLDLFGISVGHPEGLPMEIPPSFLVHLP